MDQNDWNRLGVIVALAEKMQERKIDMGRTALMKFAYLLQTVKKVPLGYDFTLYSYGPFDSMVLDDLSYAGTLGAVKERTISYAASYGYDIKPAEHALQIKEKAQVFLNAQTRDMDWVINEFGSRGAGLLELLSTIVYADQEMLQKQTSRRIKELAAIVQKIKPHFALSTVAWNARR